MKSALLSLLGLSLSGLTAQAQWVNQPIAFANTGSIPAYLDVVDATTVWTATDGLTQYVAPQLGLTTDGGQTWTVRNVPVRTNQRETITGLSALSATSAWVVTVPVDSAGSRILHTTNGGQTWTVQGRGTAFFNADSYAEVVHFFSATDGVVVGAPLTQSSGPEVYRTTDGGATWSPVTLPQALLNEYPVGIRPAVVGNTIWLATTKGRVYRSTDRGATWTVSATPTGQDPTGLAFRDAQNGLMSFLDDNGTNHLLYRTTDGGATWTPVTYAGPLHGNSLSAVPGTNQYVSVGGNLGNNDQGSSYTSNNGQTWVALESTLSHAPVEFLSSTVGWSGGFAPSLIGLRGDGVNKFTSQVLSARGTKAALQAGLTLAPNPTENGQTILRTARVFSAPAQVRVFDATGRVVAQHTWPGTNPLALDLSTHRAGLYVVEVTSPTGSIQQKVQVCY
ncbi:YCF48-related protein [Hymenobacter norwichensis]|uniref:YCF48-related protein n=1 Tax=Hymenobacter norwichensis TaxID=223903 RepID=UPI0009FF3A6E|nr:YCF48-related protein [Hymenobacter norwichensis]